MKVRRHLGFLLRFAPSGFQGRTMIVLGLVASALAGAASTGFVALINHAIHVEDRTDPELILGFVGLALSIPLTTIAAVYLLDSAVRRTQVALSLHLVEALLETPLARLEEIGIHRILSVLTSDARVLGKSLSLLPSLVRSSIIMVGCMAYMLWLSPAIFVLVVALAGVGICGFRIPQVRGRRHLGYARRQKDHLYRHFQGLTEGAKELKLHRARSRALLDRYIAATADRRMRHEVRGNTLYSVASGWGQIVFALLVGVLLFGVPSTAWFGAETLTGYVLAAIYFFSAMEALLAQAPALGRATVALENIESLGLDRRVGEASRRAVLPAETPSSPFPTPNRLELQGVTYSYPALEETERFELGPVDLELAAGEVVFLVGGNGSGKTTLAKVLTGLYAATRGIIRLDGTTVTDSNRCAYRELFSAVFSDFFLFDTLLGLEGEHVDEEGRRYLTHLQLDHKVRLEEGRWSTIQLSRGQRKRLALLVALLEDRPFFLFDEWAADQDPRFRELFYLEILPELKMRGKGVVVISHDDRYYGVGDRVVKLSEGRIESVRSPLSPASSGPGPRRRPAGRFPH